MTKFQTLFGDMEFPEDKIHAVDTEEVTSTEEETTPTETEIEETIEKEDNTKTEVEETTEVIETSATNTEVEEIPENLAGVFDSVVSSLEDDELLVLEDDKQYEPTPQGMAEMLRDSMTNYKIKLEAEKQAAIDAVRAEYETTNAVRFADMDTSDEENQEVLLREYYKGLDMTSEEIEEKIQEVKDLDKTKKEADIAQRFLAKQEKKAVEKATKEREAAEATARQERAKAIEDFRTSIMETEEIAGFKLDKKTRKDFADYLLAVGKDGKTQAQKANTADRRVKLAFLDFMDFNQSDFEIKAKTKIARETRKNQSRFTNTNVSVKGSTVKAAPEAPKGTKVPSWFGSTVVIED